MDVPSALVVATGAFSSLTEAMDGNGVLADGTLFRFLRHSESALLSGGRVLHMEGQLIACCIVMVHLGVIGL